MGHLVGKDIYRELGGRIDGLGFRVPWSETLRAILVELYSEEEAFVVASMLPSISTFEEVRATVGLEEGRLRTLLEGLCAKGLVVDVFLGGAFRYSPSPLVIGIFEFTMMRTDAGVDLRKVAGLFKELFDDRTLYGANFDGSMHMGLMRTLPYEESVAKVASAGGGFVEVLDYEKASAIIESAGSISLGLCSCRHEKLHAGEKDCGAPLETCTSFGYSADYLIRNRLARKAERGEMLEVLARSKELGLVLNSDNVKRNSQFICHCCRCCCNVLLGVRKFGYPDVVVTSSFIVELDAEACIGCGKCAAACGSGALGMLAPPAEARPGPRRASLDSGFCLGCGVCVLRCPAGALKMVKRASRVIHPESTFEKAILQGLERGSLQDLIFANPRRMDQGFMRGLVGGFLRLPPVKRALMGDALRSSFLALFKAGAKAQGKLWLTEI